MKQHLQRLVVRLAKATGYCLMGSLATLIVVGISVLNNKPDLKVWHRADLDAEFTVRSPVDTFEEYLELEDRLFAQLETEVYDRIDPEDEHRINRYHRGSLSDPGRWSKDWNRSYQLAADPSSGGPRAGILLLHGLSDSPYSLRVIGERLHDAGAHVLSLRVPGHGTAPAALARTSWKDMAAAVEIAARHLAGAIGERPLYVVGYSNGASLAVNYALSSLEDEALSRPAGIVLISPAIAVTPVAGLAIWQARLGRILGLEKLGWQSVQLEYDPFKYGSFPINGGVIAHEVTRANRATFTRLEAGGGLAEFPPVLAFQSEVDATVSASAVVSELFARLPENGHELVVIGLNRTVESEPLLRVDPMSKARRILEDPERDFAFTLLTNASAESAGVVARRWRAGGSASTEVALATRWPGSVYSLSHVALPFRHDDPLYGPSAGGGEARIHLGDVALRGERGGIRIPPGEMLRQRWNPFFPYLEERILKHFGLADEAEILPALRQGIGFFLCREGLALPVGADGWKLAGNEQHGESN